MGLSMVRDLSDVLLGDERGQRAGRWLLTYLGEHTITRDIGFFLSNSIGLGSYERSKESVKDTAHRGPSVSHSETDNMKRK